MRSLLTRKRFKYCKDLNKVNFIKHQSLASNVKDTLQMSNTRSKYVAKNIAKKIQKIFVLQKKRGRQKMRADTIIERCTTHPKYVAWFSMYVVVYFSIVGRGLLLLYRNSTVHWKNTKLWLRIGSYKNIHNTVHHRYIY